jgi:hypothetical protein
LEQRRVHQPPDHLPARQNQRHLYLWQNVIGKTILVRGFLVRAGRKDSNPSAKPPAAIAATSPQLYGVMIRPVFIIRFEEKSIAGVF